MIQSRRTFILTIFGCLAYMLNTFGQANYDLIKAPDGKNVTISSLDKHIKKVMDSAKVPGLSIAIINDSKIVYHNVFGVTNTETKLPIIDESIFEGASLSKPIFAYFAMKMVEKGVLNLDKPLYQYLEHPGIAEESKEDYKLITARMVLSHSSGFPNHAKGEKIKLPFRPGTGFLYSGEGYQYLAAVIGKLHGIGVKDDLNSLFQQVVTKPFGMTNTTFVWNDYLSTHKVFGHDTNGKPTQNSPKNGWWSGKTFNAYSSLHSESLEYARFIIALLRQEGLTSEAFDEMLKEHTHFKEDNPLKKAVGQTGWGLGLAQKPTKYGMMHLHTGNNHDFQSYMMMIPKKNFGIVFFMNGDKAIPFIEGLSRMIGPIF
ncbi:serine hydrolase domain-containing protein [uncultured Aquimarina sp.]|uniref:serine hydrolase domain-containing protein n=1 Tax=uncultured Aquimarina sp. TaxID=575652 RepID=UPI00261783D3|nr:serine hydrolase domain-containing protein [uncultured Aquimarina sp.]